MVDNKMNTTNDYCKYNKKLIQKTKELNKDVSKIQHILKMKYVIDELDKNNTGITEILLNKLMTFAYLKAEEKYQDEYKSGYNDAIADMKDKLNDLILL